MLYVFAVCVYGRTRVYGRTPYVRPYTGCAVVHMCMAGGPYKLRSACGSVRLEKKEAREERES